MEFTLKDKTNTLYIIFKVGARLHKREDRKVVPENILDSLVDLLCSDPVIPSIPHLQAPINLYRHRILDLIDSTGVAYLDFTLKNPTQT